MTNLICCACNRDSGVPKPAGGHNVGELARASNFHFIPCAEGGSRWVCGPCKTVIEDHADTLYRMLGTRDVSVNILMSKKARTEANKEEGRPI